MGGRRRARPVGGWALALACGLGVALGPGAGTLAAGDPPANVAPVPDFDAPCVVDPLHGTVVSGYCAYDPASGRWRIDTPAREAAALRALDRARGQGGGPPQGLPHAGAPLDAAEQQFVLVNLERVARGLPPLVALAPALDAVALEGARAGTDPQPSGPWTAYAFGANWAGDAQPAVAVYGYMYLDGWGGSAASTPNVDCTGPAAPGCWGHRHNVLGDYGTTGLMGAAAVPGGPGGTGSSAQVFSAYTGPPVPVRYTWTEALRHGAGGGPTPAPEADPLWPFADMATAPWAAGAAATLAAAGVVQGTGPGVFSPDRPVTLQEMVTLLGRTLAWPVAPAAAPPDVAPWAAGYWGRAAAAGLVPADADPTAALSRLQAVRLVVEALGLLPAAPPSPPPELAALAPADAQAVATALADGLLRGVGSAGLELQAGLSRSQAAVLLLRAALWQVRTGRLGALGSLHASASALADGGVLYTAGSLHLLAPAPSTDPTAYWRPDGEQGEDVLVDTGGAWWSGRASWLPAPAPAWAAGATAFGSAKLLLWPAGQRGAGPALFAPTVLLLAFGQEVKALPPGAGAWRPASPEDLQDPARAVVEVLGPP